MSNKDFSNIGNFDMELVQQIKDKFGNMNGFHWSMNEDSDIVGWYWSAEHDKQSNLRDLHSLSKACKK
jgi:hypothetical protein